jgi:hypothetical protein
MVAAVRAAWSNIELILTPQANNTSRHAVPIDVVSALVFRSFRF